MKLFDLNCPKCGAQLKIDDKITKGFCEHCGTVVLIDDEVQHIQYDNAEEAGYNFEKGRQRARAEVQGVSGQTSFGMEKMQPPKKKRRTWLWVLGWIFIFPVPLTVLIGRSKLKKPMKVILIVALWAIILLIAALNKKSESSRPISGPSDITQNTTFDQPSNTVVESEPDYKELFATEMKDDNVFFQDYVLKDLTDRWRLCGVISSEQVINHAVTYYRAYFEDDKEVHAVINYGLKTTTKLTVNGVYIIAQVYEHVDNEELDAKDLFSGLFYNSYLINKVTGEIELIDNSVPEDDSVNIENADQFIDSVKTMLESLGVYDGAEVTLQGKELYISVKEAIATNNSLTPENKAYLHAVTITDEFLRHKGYDPYWDKITIHFDGIGKYILTKEDIMDSGEFGRFFNFLSTDIIVE